MKIFHLLTIHSTRLNGLWLSALNYFCHQNISLIFIQSIWSSLAWWCVIRIGNELRSAVLCGCFLLLSDFRTPIYYIFFFVSSTLSFIIKRIKTVNYESFQLAFIGSFKESIIHALWIGVIVVCKQFNVAAMLLIHIANDADSKIVWWTPLLLLLFFL